MTAAREEVHEAHQQLRRPRALDDGHEGAATGLRIDSGVGDGTANIRGLDESGELPQLPSQPQRLVPAPFLGQHQKGPGVLPGLAAGHVPHLGPPRGGNGKRRLAVGSLHPIQETRV